MRCLGCVLLCSVVACGQALEPRVPSVYLRGEPQQNHKVNLSIFNPSNDYASLESFVTSCGCATPKISPVRCSPKQQTNIDIVLDTEMMAPQFPDGGSILLKPLLRSDAGKIIACEPITLDVKLARVLRADVTSILVSEHDTTAEFLVNYPVDCQLDFTVPSAEIRVEATPAGQSSENNAGAVYQQTARIMLTVLSVEKVAGRIGPLQIHALHPSGKPRTSLAIPIQVVSSPAAYLSQSIFLMNPPDSEVATVVHGVPSGQELHASLLGTQSMQLVSSRYDVESSILTMALRISHNRAPVSSGKLRLVGNSFSHEFDVRFCMVSQ